MISKTDLASQNFTAIKPAELEKLFEFASKCDLKKPDSCRDSVQRVFIVLMLTTFRTWSRENGGSFDVLDSVQFLLRNKRVRSELTVGTFRRSLTSPSQIDMTFRLLFQAAQCRSKLVANAANNSLVMAWATKP